MKSDLLESQFSAVIGSRRSTKKGITFLEVRVHARVCVFNLFRSLTSSHAYDYADCDLRHSEMGREELWSSGVVKQRNLG